MTSRLSALRHRNTDRRPTDPDSGSREPFLSSVLAVGVVALLCNLALELVRTSQVDQALWQDKDWHWAGLFGLGTLVLWAVLAVLHALVGRLSVTTGAATLLTAFVAVVDHEKVQQLQEPLYPTDWRFLGQLGLLTEWVGGAVLVLLLVTVVVALLGSVLLVRLARRVVPALRPRPLAPGPRRQQLVARVVVGVLGVVVLTNAAHFNAPDNATRNAYEALGAEWRPWSQQRNYLGNTFVAGFLYNLDVPAADRPADYTVQTMARIVERYTRLAARINERRSPDALEGTNVVIVLSETFSDPTQLRGLRMKEDPIPVVRELMRTETAGDALAQQVGTGTANMEFEALTGLSTALMPLQLRVPYQMLVPTHDRFPSAVRYLEQLGHRPVALHSFEPQLYRRQEVYRTLGFDDFVDESEMRYTSTIGNRAYISDMATFAEAQRLMRENDRPLLLNVVTMQNHLPYAQRYDERWFVRGPNGRPVHPAGMYIRGLNHTDQAVATFLNTLEQSPERTVVAFYGDHLPNIYPERVERLSSDTRLRRLPMWVWANFPGPRRSQPMMNPTHVMDLVLERADAPVPPYYALLTKLRRLVPAIDHRHFYGPTGRAVREDDLSPLAAKVLHDYELVQYDLAFGQRHSVEEMFGRPSGSSLLRAHQNGG
jgi:phosphoglycerol transferase MdoB-like AlkP superfamily enzyme